MKKWNDDGLKCESCMGDVLDCKPWIKSIGLKWCGEKTKAYANKAQTEALLQWHNDKYGSIGQARRDNQGDAWLKAIRAEFKPKETPKPFATLEEFDMKLIRFFVESRRVEFYQLCACCRVPLKDIERIIAGIKC